MSQIARLVFSAVLSLSIPAMAATIAADDATQSPLVGGPPSYPYKTIVENAAGSRDHTKLMAAMKAAGLLETLEGPGPFTVFAPTDEAFAKLPPGALAMLDQPQKRASLIKLLTYHVVPGKLTAARIRSAIKAGGGTATLTTVEGEPLIASLYDDKIVLTDVKGGAATITIGNVMQSNGLIHVVDAVLMP
jgi:uncharacterized surface protein with fasciclin (FAS1) repeats